MDIFTIPGWLGSALIGAIIALVSFVLKAILEWIARVKKDEKQRRAQLTELWALIRAGDAAWAIQCENRNRLNNLIEQRDPMLTEKYPGYENRFTAAFANMSKEEKELHQFVRAITMHTFQPLNDSILNWLRNDNVFRVHTQDISNRGKLAIFLSKLEVHLLLWEAKYKACIPNKPEGSLIYLDDEQRHGIGFPKNGAEVINDVLLNGKWISA